MSDAVSPDQTVYISGSNGGRSPNKFHTDPDCATLANARSVLDKPRGVLYDDLEQCKRCGGEWRNND